jgi:hypothetical protein
VAKNLLPCLAHLTKDECNEIVYAVSYFSSRYRTNPPPYNDREALAILDPEEVIKALHKVHSHYGTAAALDLAHKLERICDISSSQE